MTITDVKIESKAFNIYRYGWILQDGLFECIFGWFKSLEDKIYFELNLVKLFKEVNSVRDILPLLVLCAQSDEQSCEYQVAIGYLEKYLDSQVDVNRALVIHSAVYNLIQYSTFPHYDIKKKFSALRKAMKCNVPKK